MGISEQLLRTLDTIVGEAMKDDAAVAFSGGLDSGIIAALAGRYGKTMLWTVGSAESYDVEASREMAENMGLPWKHIELRTEEIEEELREMMKLTGTVNPITLSFEIPLFYVLKYSPQKVIMSGQGADELFAGYSKYEGLGDKELNDRMKNDLMNLMNVTLKHEQKVADHFGKKLIYPYLDERILNIVETMDIRDLAPKDLRKEVLREVAVLMDHPEIAAKPKKAAQYGSGTMDALRKVAKKNGTTVSGLISKIAEEL